jgi:hypothetical protein
LSDRIRRGVCELGQFGGQLTRPGIQDTDDTDCHGAARYLVSRNIGTELGAIPAKLSDSVRATVTAGLAKLVELVNQ